jgi:hypothetical protein
VMFTRTDRGEPRVRRARGTHGVAV